VTLATPINNLKTQCDNSAGPLYEAGWDFYSVDTNTGVGGKFIYIGYQLGDATPVTSLDFKAYSDAQSSPPAGWSWSSQDLKEGAGGKFIYMLWKNDEAEKAPILSVLLVVTPLSEQPTIPGYIAIHQDLNQGAGGPFIWPYYSTTVPFTAKNEEVLRKA
jgi:hypothetical protein